MCLAPGTANTTKSTRCDTARTKCALVALTQAWTNRFVLHPSRDTLELARLAPSLPAGLAALSGDELLAALHAHLNEHAQAAPELLAALAGITRKPEGVPTAALSASSKATAAAAVAPPAPAQSTTEGPLTAAPASASRSNTAAAPAHNGNARVIAVSPARRAAAAAARDTARAAADADDARLIDELIRSNAFWAATPLRPRATVREMRDGEYELVITGVPPRATDGLELGADASAGTVSVRGVVSPRDAAERAELASAAVRSLRAPQPSAVVVGRRQHRTRRATVAAALRRIAEGRFGRVEEALRVPSDALIARATRADAGDGDEIVVRVPRAAVRHRRTAVPRMSPAVPFAREYEPGWALGGLTTGGPGYLW